VRSLCRSSLVFALLAFLPACHRAVGREKVVATVFPVYDLVRRIAGPDADVLLVGSDSAGAGAANANLVVEVGLGFDAWMDAVVPAKTRVLRVGDRVPTLTTASGSIDPHVWMDPQRARLMVTAIAEEMARVDASHANAFRERAAAVDASLDALDRELDTRAAAWKTRAVASEGAPAMRYFGERYHIDVVGLDAATPGEPRATLDSGGAANEATASYESLLRDDTAALDKVLR
jgi:ABC-type Zn uptake system ZnuABC Zn-binding protein ZnuA